MDSLPVNTFFFFFVSVSKVKILKVKFFFKASFA